MFGFGFDKTLSILTFAGIAGLLLFNADSTVKIFNSLGSQSIGYVKAVQGR